MRAGLIAAAVCCIAAGCASAAAHRTVGISTLERGNSVDRLAYDGNWQFVSHRHDGRFEGSSARAFRPGDSMSVVFRGTRMRLYGITGKNGGNGLLLVPGVTSRTISFYSAKPSIHKLLFDSGAMPDAIHSAGIVVTGRGASRKPGYVNIDEVEIDR